jgi:hypothetical protein
VFLSACTDAERAGTHYIGRRVALLKPSGVTAEYVRFLRETLKGVLICVTEKAISEDEILRTPVQLDRARCAYEEIVKAAELTEFTPGAR